MSQRSKINALFNVHPQKIHVSPVVSNLLASKEEQTLKMRPITKPLNVEEKKYLLAVERSDLATVKRILERVRIHKHLMDPNCCDSLGRNALILAIDGENLEMLELLVSLGVDTKDALLHAINVEFVEAVEMLIENEERFFKKGHKYNWQNVDPTIASFTSDITPLVLAAHRNNYEILKLLLDKGATLPMPHDIKCGCDDCIKGTKDDSLRHSLSRVNEYRALASPSLISLSSCDPLLTAFQLSWELRKLASAEPECKGAYMDLRKQCQKFAVDLLQQSRSSQELAIILNHDPHKDPYRDGDRMRLSRLRLAIEYKQKEFVAHPHIQQLLAAIWYEGVPGFRRKSHFRKILIVSKVGLFFPFYCVLNLIAPKTKYGAILKKPFMKFLIHAYAYLSFLVLLILVSQRSEYKIIQYLDGKSNAENQTEIHRGNSPSYLEFLLVAYIIGNEINSCGTFVGKGFIYEEAKEIFKVGLTSYLRNLWNAIEFARNLLYFLCILFRTTAYVKQKREISLNPETAFIPREEWDPFDPQLIGEGLFAAGNIFSALKLIYLFSINPYLGPLQISLGRMIIDIVKFFFIYSLVLFAFACGLNQLLWYYSDLERKKCYQESSFPDWENYGDSCSKWRLFANVFESIQSLFWASFGMININSFELEGIKSYTRFWAMLMFGAYSVINVIVLLNLLIAMMSNSYAAIDCHSDTEWKFAKTKLWISYFDEIPTLPPPFNLLAGIKWFRRLTRVTFKKEKSLLNELSQEDYRYSMVMRALVWRYITSMNRKNEESSVTEDDVNEIKNEISAFRFEMLEILKRNGMDVSSAQKRLKGAQGKKMKIWERRLMKDFKVAPMNSEEVVIEIPPVPENETSLCRFRRIAKLALLQSNLNKWKQTVDSVYSSNFPSPNTSIASNRGQNSLSIEEPASENSQKIHKTKELDRKELRAKFFKSHGIFPTKHHSSDM